MIFANLDYSVLGEFVSCLLSAVLCVNILFSASFFERRHRLFLIGGISSFLSTFFDIAAAYCITYHSEVPVWICYASSTLFFTFLLAVPFLLCSYAYELAFAYNPKNLKIGYIINISLYAFYILIIITNIKTGLIFRYDPVEGYVRGPLKNLTYILTFVFTILTMISIATNKKSVATRVFVIFLLYPFISVSVILIQFFNPTFLLTGASSFSALLMAYITVQSDMLEFDIVTGLMTDHKLCKYIEMKNREGYLYLITIENMVVLQNIMDSVNLNKMLMKIGKILTSKFQRHVYHPVTSRFAVLSHNLEDIKQFSSEIGGLFSELQLDPELNLPVPLEIYCVAVELSKGEKKYSSVMEIANNMIQKVKIENKHELCICDETILLEMERRRIIFKILKRELNLESKQFQVWFQPIYSVNEKKFTYMEALSRLRGTELGDISPAEFVYVAEKRGLIEQLGFVAFEKVCKYIADNRDVIKAVSINFSVYQMTERNIVRNVLETVARFGLNPSNIIMEITESIFIDNYALVLKNMNELAAAGVQFYLDDFGTGYSNLANVIRLPFSTIKIDRTLVLMMEENEKNQRLFMNLVDTFKDASLKILVEGVETQSQNYLVQKAGADYIQGFLYSRPQPPDICLEIMKNK